MYHYDALRTKIDMWLTPYVAILISEHFHITWFRKFTVENVVSLISVVWGKYVSITFLFTLIYLQCCVFSESFIATTIMMLTPPSCYHMTSFNYGGKKARDEGLTYRCHQSNVIPDSIFFDSLGWGMIRGFFYLFVFKGW